MRFLAWITVLAVCLSCSISAAQDVRYDVLFNATWSATRHPGAYPAGAHFSPLWIASHNENVDYWELGGIASDAIEQMAETGGTSRLNAEFNAAENAGNALDQDVLFTINSPGVVRGRVRVEPSHPLITVVTMIAPSPDWFVGVDSLNFWESDRFVDSLIVDVFAYDAGTDSGSTFTSPNADTNPREPIALLGDPFTGLPRLGTLTFTRLPLAGDTNDDDAVNIDDLGNVRNNFSFALPGVIPLGDTYPFDGVVNVDDLNAVRNNFGASLPTRIIPEPSAGVIALVCICLAGYAVFGRRERAVAMC